MTFIILREVAKSTIEYYVLLNHVREDTGKHYIAKPYIAFITLVDVSLDVHEEFIGLYKVGFICSIFY